MSCVPWVPSLGFYIITSLLLVLCIMVAMVHRSLVKHSEWSRHQLER